MKIRKRFIAHEYVPRLDVFLTGSLPAMSRTQIGKLIVENAVLLNNKPVSRKNQEVHPGDTVELEILQPEIAEYHPTFQFRRLYEDDFILIIDKPAGISIHKGSGEKQETILDAFQYYYPQVMDIPDEDRPGIVHRLDRETSGILILAKEHLTMKRLQKQFKRREVIKTYLALASGHMRYITGTIDAPIIRHPRHRTRYTATTWDNPNAEKARDAITEYSVIRQFEDFSYLRLTPQTGRTHQLRVHLAHTGNPILGDNVYGRNHPYDHLALHAWRIEFRHPVTGSVLVSYSPIPTHFWDYMRRRLREQPPKNLK